MNKKEIINKLKNNNKNIKYADFCSILKYFGFVCKRQRGSHKMLMEKLNLIKLNNS